MRALPSKRTSNPPKRFAVDHDSEKRKRSKGKGGKGRGKKKKVQRVVEGQDKSELCTKVATDLFFHCMIVGEYFMAQGTLELYQRTAACGSNLEAGTFATQCCFGNDYMKVRMYGVGFAWCGFVYNVVGDLL